MNFKRRKIKLNFFKKKLKHYESVESTEINSIIQWRNQLQKKIKTTSKLINVNQQKS